MRPDLSAYHAYLQTEAIGYCGWCVYHRLDWQAEPHQLMVRAPKAAHWPLYCTLDDALTNSFGTCAAWKNTLVEVSNDALGMCSAHEKAELTRTKLATFRWTTPARDAH